MESIIGDIDDEFWVDILKEIDVNNLGYVFYYNLFWDLNGWLYKSAYKRNLIIMIIKNYFFFNL